MSVPTHYQCPTCQGAATNSRNLAVFIDGTSNKPGDESTNVWKLSRQVELVEDSSGPKQPKPLYLTGIGAYDTDHLSLLDRTGTKIRSIIEMGFAWHAENNVKKAYTWLVENYRRGDRIYLFGFSRGAYQVRALAGMIHEVGLVKDKVNVDVAYGHYLSIRPFNPEQRRKRMVFRKELCQEGVRIHFVGVWDTVSSLGLVKKTVHITASATVTNACYFRHALALDERRVKFMPEYFTEVNAHRSNTKSQRSDVCNVKEVWFAGVHSDVGGQTRKHVQVDDPSGHDDSESFPVHAGNVTLLWMRREAAANGLVFKPEGFTWDPEDVDDGRKDSMTIMWKLLFEFFPVRQQISFSGTGTHKRRLHLSRARTVIPDQRIHFSILSGDVYTPRAALRENIHVPSGAQEASDNLWTSELPDEGETLRLLTLLLSDQQKTMESLERVLFLLDSGLNGLTQKITIPRWMEGSIQAQSGFDKFALTVIYDVISNFSAPKQLLERARDTLCGLLTSRQDYSRGFYVLRFATKHELLRRHFITPNVIGALMSALEWTAKSPNKKLFPMVMDSLRNLINDSHSRGDVVNQLLPSPDEKGTRQTRLSVALEMKEPSQLKAWLNLIVSFAQYHADLCRELKPKIVELAKTERSSVGWAAVEALAALSEPLNGDILFSNVLGYLGNVLPPLDVEVGGTTPSDITGDLPAGLYTVDSGKPKLDEKAMHKLVSTIESRNVHERITATLTLLKLCRYSTIRNFCSQNKVVDVFMKQLERKETSLPAAYALKTFLERGMPPSDFDRAARLIVGMLNKGWFDDAVGRIEGFDVFRGFMTFVNLRQQIMKLDIIPTLMKKLEGGKHHDARTSLICLDILGSYNSVELTSIVEKSIHSLKDNCTQTQTKGIKTLATLAKTKAGEEVISQHVIDIVKMLPEPSGSPSRRSLGPAAALYDLSKNETLRNQIRGSQEFLDWKIRHQRQAQV